MSSPENSEILDHTKNTIKKNGNIQDGRDDKQKTILLRIPNVVEPDQLVY